MSSTPPLIRFAHPMAFQIYLRQIGAPVGCYLRHNGLPEHCHEPGVFVPVVRVWAFFNEAARINDPYLGWDVGEFVGDHSLNANLLRKIEKAPTLLIALQTLTRLVRTEGSDIDIGVQERHEDVILYTHYRGLRDMPGYHISQAYQLSVFIDLIRFFLGDEWHADEIGLEAPSVPPGLKKRFPGTRILLRQALGYIAIPRNVLHHAACHAGSPVSGANASLTIPSFHFHDKVLTLLRAYLPDGYVSERQAAELMETSVRTMTRKLGKHGTSYGALVDQVRFEVAKENLQKQSLGVIDVARSVGFADQANFTRMFRRMAGITPGRYRKVTRGEG